MNCYVYIYLDPRKPGMYEYNGISFHYEPFYIGCGSGNRINDHKYYMDKPNPTKRLIVIRLCEIYKEIGSKFIYKYKIEEGLNRSKARKRESFWIKTIGRLDMNCGPLTNHTDGQGIKNICDERMPWKGKKVTDCDLIERCTKHFIGDGNPQRIRKMKGLPTTSEMYYKGKTFEERFGVNKAKEIKRKISENHADISGKNNPMAKLTPEQLQSMKDKTRKTMIERGYWLPTTA